MMNNCSTWSNQLRAHLMSKGLYQYIAEKDVLVTQCFVFRRNIGKVTPKIIYFHFLIKYFPDQSIQKNILYNFEKRNNVVTLMQHARRGTVAVTAASTIDLTTDAATTDYLA